MDKRTPEVKEKISRVAEETGTEGRYKALTEELNKRGITSPRGSKWQAQGLYNFCSRQGLFKDAPASKIGKGGPRPDALATQDTTPEKQAEPEEHVSTPKPKLLQPESLQLDIDTIATLKEIVAWWKTEGARMVTRNVTGESEPSEPTYRATFPGGKEAKTNTGIRINKRLLNDALAKARTPEEMIKTGGSLSPLIERLLWQYLKFDPKYLTRR